MDKKMTEKKGKKLKEERDGVELLQRGVEIDQ